MLGISPERSAATKIQARVRGHQVRNEQLLEAIKSNNISQLTRLINAGINVNVTNKYGLTPLHLAAYKGYEKIFQLLVKAEADVNVTNEFGLTPLYYAAMYGHADIVEALFNAGANLDTRDYEGRTVLINQVSKGNLEMVEVLVNTGADVDAADDMGAKPLHKAAINGDLEIANLLINKGADVDAADNMGTKPLHIAVKNGHVKIVEALVIAGADLTDNDGGTVLDWAKDKDFFNIKNAIEEGKKKLISLYKNHKPADKYQVILKELQKESPILQQGVFDDPLVHALIKPLLQNEPKNLNETQIQQAKKYIEEREEAAAAAKIQAMARGNQVRNE